MNNQIILRSVYGKVQQVYYIQPCSNPRTLRLPDCVKPVDSNGDMILSEDDVKQMSSGLKHFIPANHVFEIVDGTTFNLDDIIDAANWAAIEFCNWIAKDRYQRDHEGNLIIDGGAKKYGAADLYVERPGEITKSKINKKQLIHRASTYIYEDSIPELIKKCRVLGRDLSNAANADIIDYLIDKAEKEPTKVINMYEGEDWKMQLFVLDAVDRGVIRRSDNIFRYNDMTLGASMEATIIFLRDIRYKKIVDSIKLETYPNLRPKSEINQLQQEVDNTLLNQGEEGLDSGEIISQKPAKPNKPSTAK